MNYTKNYHLPQWVKEDRIMMDDFNQMCADMESGLNSNAQAAETAYQAARDAKTEALKLPYVVGTYTGDGAEARNISLGFRASFIIVSGLYELVGRSSGADLFFIATAGTAFSTLFALTDDGFRVKHSSGLYPDLNDPNQTYDYIAFR